MQETAANGRGDCNDPFTPIPPQEVAEPPQSIHVMKQSADAAHCQGVTCFPERKPQPGSSIHIQPGATYPKVTKPHQSQGAPQLRQVRGNSGIPP